MDNEDNFLMYLRSLNPPVQKDEFGQKVKTFQILNVSAIEQYLELPNRLIYNFIQGEKYRSLGVHREKVVTFFTTVGYNEQQSYSQFL